MTEILLEKDDETTERSQPISMKTNNEADEYSSSKSNLFAFDVVSDTLKHIYSRSKLRKKLSSGLSTFYSYPILIILFSFLIGLLFFGLSMLFIYFKIFSNFMKPIIFLIFLTLFFSILIIIIRVSDDLKNKINIGAKWERKNILKNIGLILTLTVLVVSAFFFHHFFNKLINYNEANDIYVYDHSNNSNESKYDFLFEYIINCYLIDENKKDEEIKVNFNDDKSVFKNLHKNLVIAFIPLSIFCISKIIKTILIEVKYTIPKFIVYINYFLLIILIFISHFLYDKGNDNWFLISLFEIILLSFIYIGYIMWTIASVCKLNQNPKDKSFAIFKYDLGQLFIIFVFDIINMLGSSSIYISFIINYISYVNDKIKYKDISNSLLSLKIGFLLCLISNSYYYGHHLLSLIFRPIALQYAPPKLKEDYYIRANRNLSFFSLIH